MSVRKSLCFTFGVAFALGLGSSTVAGAGAQYMDNRDRCVNKGAAFTPDVRIDACTALMQGGLPQKTLAYAFNNRALAFVAKGDFDRAIADFTDAIRLAPDFAHALYNRGATYQARGDYEHAIADYTEAIRLDPTYTRAYKNRGLAYQAKGDYAHANADLKEASRLTSTAPRK